MERNRSPSNVTGLHAAVRDLVKSARLFANESHERFSAGRNPALQNFSSHLKSVAQIVSTVTQDEETIAAAWLHDIVEDTAVTLCDLERRFGAGVAKLVGELTVPSHAGYRNHVTRIAHARKHFALASGAAKTVKLADLIDTCRDLHRNNPISLISYASEANDLASVLEGGDTRLLERLQRNLQEYALDSLPVQSDAVVPRFRLLAIPIAALRVFQRAITAQHIAEPLVSFDSDLGPGEILAAITSAGIEVAGLYRRKTLWGFVEASSLRPGDCEANGKEFAASQVVNARSSLPEVIDVLTRHDRCFVSARGNVVGVISRGDLHKPAARMWLFGIITVTELEAAEHIRQNWPEDSWAALLSQQRLNRAKQLHAERERRKEKCPLLDCLHLSDKIEILMSDASERAALGIPSASAAAKAGKQIERLRNKVAHAHSFDEKDWPQIVRLAKRIQHMLDES